MTRLTAILVAAFLVLPAVPIAAQSTNTAPADSSVDLLGTVAVVTDYRFRGISLSNEKVVPQGSLTVAHDSGLYAGVWASRISDTPLYGKVELDLIGGYATEIASGTRLDVGMTYYTYPDGDSSAGDSDYFEPAVKLSHTLGPVTATATAAYAWDQSALGDDDSLYLNLGVTGGVPNTPVTLVGGVGHTDGALGALAPGGDYWDWQLGADYVVGPVTIGVRYVDTDIKKTGVKAVDKLYTATALASVTFAF